MTPTSDREIVITRLLKAPRELVFQAWTDPKQVAQWWGPHCFTTPVCEIDLQPGGTWHYVMRSPNGDDYPIRNVYVEIVPPERLVYASSVEASEIWKGTSPPPNALNTLTFEEFEGQTKLTIVTLLGSVQEREAMAKKGYVEGMTQSLERLESLLATG